MLQEKNLDICEANELLDGVLWRLQDERLNSENSFNHFFKRSTAICNKLEVRVTLPRRANRQIYRHNFAAANPEEFFRCSVFVPYMDQIISDLDNRFQDQRATCTLLWCLLPTFCHSAADDQINPIPRGYRESCCGFSRNQTMDQKIEREKSNRQTRLKHCQNVNKKFFRMLRPFFK